MPDPITALKRYDGDATPVPALPPEEVRRRGDRLRRRNRLVVGATTLAVVAAVTSGTYAAVHDRSNHHNVVPTAHVVELTPDGYQGLHLGMTAAQAERTGEVRLQSSPEGSCDTFDLADYPPRTNQTDGYLSHRLGVVAIFARPGMTTPEGIELGSTLDETKAAYPDGKMQQGYWVAELGAGSEYEFGISDGKVHELGLTRSDQDCFG